MPSDGKQIHGFLRQEEMNALIANETDPITADLMSQAAHLVVLKVIRGEEGPLGDFDLRYFMEVIQEFASDHEMLRQTLEGKVHKESWLTDDES